MGTIKIHTKREIGEILFSNNSDTNTYSQDTFNKMLDRFETWPDYKVVRQVRTTGLKIKIFAPGKFQLI